MFKYYKSIILTIILGCVVSSKTFGSDQQEERDHQFPLQFKSFNYNPQIKRFEGDFFLQAGDVLSQLGGFFTGKYMTIFNMKLPEAQESLKNIALGFNQEEFDRLKKQKINLTGKEIIINPQDLEHYKALKKQEGKIILQTEIIEYLNIKCKKYDKLRHLMSDASEIIQKIFYLEMLHPKALTITHYHYYIFESGEMHPRQSIQWNISAQDITSIFTPEDINRIDFRNLKENSIYFFNFMENYASQLFQKKIDSVQYVKDYLSIKKSMYSKEFKKILVLLESSGIDFKQPDVINNLNNRNQEYFIKELRNNKIKTDEEIRPIAHFYFLFLEAFESFQKEQTLKIQQ